MAKHRQVSSDFWSDTFVEDLDPIEKLLYLYLITNDRNNLVGIYEISTKRIGNETGIDRDMVKKIINRFAEKDKIHYIDDYIIIVNFHKYTSKSPTTTEAKYKILEELPDSVKEFITSQKSKIYDSVLIGYRYPIDTLWVSIYKSISIDKNISNNIKQEEEKEKPAKEKETPKLSKFGFTKPSPPLENIKADWNAFAVANGLPQVAKLTKGRKKRLVLRMQDKDFDFPKILEAIKKSPFCLGESKDGWQISFDFLIQNDENYLKVLEGKYQRSNNYQKSNRPSSPPNDDEFSLEGLYDGRK